MQDAKEAKQRKSGWRGKIHSLRVQVGLMILISYLIPMILLGAFSGILLLRGIKDKTEAAITSGAEHAFAMTKQNVSRAVELARDATYDGELTAAWEKWNGGTAGDAEYLRLCRGYLERKYSREPLFCFAGCFPVSRPEILMSIRGSVNDSPAYLQELQQAVTLLGEKLDTRARFFSFSGRMYLVRNLLNLRMERYGMLILEVSRENLLEPLAELKKNWNAEIAVRLDAYGNRGENWDQLTPGLTDDMRAEKLEYVSLSGGEENVPDLKVTMNRREQYREVYDFSRLFICMYLLLIPILILMGIYLRRRLTKPITLLSDASRRLEQGELGVTVPMHGSDELGRLGESFSHMSLRLKELIDRTYKEEIELKNAQILALQSRINPHFMNNALEDINWQARIEGSETISAMVSSLSILLNATMARKDQRLVTLREEMEVADAYIYFVQQRFGPELTVEKETESGAMDSILPLLTVQPLLENAVEHGIAPAGGGRITIQAKRAGECLQLGIINTGRGAEKEDRERIDAALRGCATDNHVGLANIVNRLRLIYGEKVVIRVETEQPGETGVFIDIPQELPAGREKT